MKWYMMKLVFQIICGDGNHTPQFDEQLRLVHAADEDTAFAKAKELGESEAETFYNQKEQLVQWRFINVSELYCLSLVDGAELFSHINEVEHANDYIDLVHAKAEQIKEKHSYKLLQLL
jgi:hypothetical protein